MHSDCKLLEHPNFSFSITYLWTLNQFCFFPLHSNVYFVFYFINTLKANNGTDKDILEGKKTQRNWGIDRSSSKQEWSIYTIYIEMIYIKFRRNATGSDEKKWMRKTISIFGFSSKWKTKTGKISMEKKTKKERENKIYL